MFEMRVSENSVLFPSHLTDSGVGYGNVAWKPIFFRITKALFCCWVPCFCSQGWDHCFPELQTCPLLHHNQDTDLVRHNENLPPVTFQSQAHPAPVPTPCHHPQLLATDFLSPVYAILSCLEYCINGIRNYANPRLAFFHSA